MWYFALILLTVGVKTFKLRLRLKIVTVFLRLFTSKKINNSRVYFLALGRNSQGKQDKLGAIHEFCRLK